MFVLYAENYKSLLTSIVQQQFEESYPKVTCRSEKPPLDEKILKIENLRRLKLIILQLNIFIQSLISTLLRLYKQNKTPLSLLFSKKIRTCFYTLKSFFHIPVFINTNYLFQI